MQLAGALSLCCLFVFVACESSTTTETWTPSKCPDRCICSMLFSERFEATLRTVDCSHKSFSAFPASVPGETQVLLLRGNRIQDIKTVNLWLPGLLELDLADNRIRTLGFEPVFDGAYNLRHLDLSHNKLSSISSLAFDGLFNLEELSLAENQISAIMNDGFRGLNKLESLDLGGNLLTYIHRAWFASVPGLYVLNLDRNRLQLIQDDAFQPLHNLRSLDLSQNRIFRIMPHGFDGMDNLEYLMLGQNVLYEVPHAINSLKVLRSINLSHNAIYRLSAGAFSGHRKLKDVGLANLANLRLIEAGAFFNLPELLMVELHDNPVFTYIDAEAFSKCPTVAYLWLHNNNLAAIDKELLSSLPALQEVSLYGNPLACDCNARWLREAVQQEKPRFKEFERIVCDYPEQQRFQLLISIPLVAFPETCAPRILNLMEGESTVKIGQDMFYDCRAIGQPKPKIEWILPNLEWASTQSEGLALKNRGETLILRNIKPEDAGRYACHAQNLVGTAQLSTHLTVNRFQVHLFATRLSPTEATLIWNGTDRAREVFQIYYRPLNEDVSKTQYAGTVTPIMRSYTVKNLQPNTVYEACIAFEDADKVIVQISCTKFETLGMESLLAGIERTSNVAVGAALGIVACMLIVVCLAAVGFKRNRSRTYDNLNKLEAGTLSHTQNCKSSMDQLFIAQMGLRDTDNVYCPLMGAKSSEKVHSKLLVPPSQPRPRLDSCSTLVSECSTPRNFEQKPMYGYCNVAQH